MAETMRTWATISGTTLADNTTGDISPQDLRDAVYSTACYGGMTVKDGAPVTESITSTPAKATFWAADLPSRGVVPDSTTDNDLTIPTGGDGDYQVTLTMCWDVSAVSSQVVQFHIRLNGAETGENITRTMASAAIGSGACSTILTLAAGDILTVYIEIAGTTRTLQVYSAGFIARRLA